MNQHVCWQFWWILSILTTPPPLPDHLDIIIYIRDLWLVWPGLYPRDCSLHMVDGDKRRGQLRGLWGQSEQWGKPRGKRDHRANVGRHAAYSRPCTQLQAFRDTQGNKQTDLHIIHEQTDRKMQTHMSACLQTISRLFIHLYDHKFAHVYAIYSHCVCTNVHSQTRKNTQTFLQIYLSESRNQVR